MLIGKKVIPSRKGSSTRNFFRGGAAWPACAAGAAGATASLAAPAGAPWAAAAAGAAGAAGWAVGAGAQEASARQSMRPNDTHAVSGRIAWILSPRWVSLLGPARPTRARRLASEVGAAPVDDLAVEVLHDPVQH